MTDFLDHLRKVNAARWTAWSGPGPITWAEMLYASNEFGGEAGEVQNVIKKLVREERGWRGSRSTVEKLGDEIADAIICLDTIARMYGIDLREAVIKKFNATSDEQGFPHKLNAPTQRTQHAISCAIYRTPSKDCDCWEHKLRAALGPQRLTDPST